MSESLSLTIDATSNLKKQYVETLEKNGKLFVNMEAIEGIDLSGIQLLVSLVRESVLSKKWSIHLTGTIQESVKNALCLAGLSDTSCSTGEELEYSIKAVL